LSGFFARHRFAARHLAADRRGGLLFRPFYRTDFAARFGRGTDSPCFLFFAYTCSAGPRLSETRPLTPARSWAGTAISESDLTAWMDRHAETHGRADRLLHVRTLRRDRRGNRCGCRRVAGSIVVGRRRFRLRRRPEKAVFLVVRVGKQCRFARRTVFTVGRAGLGRFLTSSSAAS